MPSKSGKHDALCRSHSTRSGGGRVPGAPRSADFSIASPSPPLAATLTAKPWRSSRRDTSLALRAWSSTSRQRGARCRSPGAGVVASRLPSAAADAVRLSGDASGCGARSDDLGGDCGKPAEGTRTGTRSCSSAPSAQLASMSPRIVRAMVRATYRPSPVCVVPSLSAGVMKKGCAQVRQHTARAQ